MIGTRSFYCKGFCKISKYKMTHRHTWKVYWKIWKREGLSETNIIKDGVSRDKTWIFWSQKCMTWRGKQLFLSVNTISSTLLLHEVYFCFWLLQSHMFKTVLTLHPNKTQRQLVLGLDGAELRFGLRSFCFVFFLFFVWHLICKFKQCKISVHALCETTTRRQDGGRTWRQFLSLG